MSPPSHPRRRERGVVIIYFAFFLFVALWFIALGTDMARLYVTRTELQNAADAAALAGASAIDPGTGSINPDTAIVRAQVSAYANKALRDGPEPVVLATEDIEFPESTLCKVTVRRTEDASSSIVVYFARVIGIPYLEMTATATAKADVTREPCEGLVPMGPVEPPNSGWFDPDCSKSYQLKVGAGDGQQGNYELLDYPTCNEGPCAGLNGGAAVRCYAQNGYGCCLDEGTEFSLTEPGNKVGPFRQGMQARWDADTDRRANICYSDYHGNGNRILPMPIIESFDVNGKKFVKIIKFASFFIKERPPSSATLTGQFIHDVVPGNGAGQGKGMTLTLRLVE
jgi:Flp pilus assembly protein TadG